MGGKTERKESAGWEGEKGRKCDRVGKKKERKRKRSSGGMRKRNTEGNIK